MKPDTRFCRWCGVELEGRADKEFCSEAHKKRLQRSPELEYKRDKPIIKGTSVPAKQDTNIKRDNLTQTDKSFYDRAMREFNKPYYNFEGHGFKKHSVHRETCRFCNKEFETVLDLLKYCSYEHYHQSLRSTA